LAYRFRIERRPPDVSSRDRADEMDVRPLAPNCGSRPTRPADLAVVSSTCTQIDAGSFVNDEAYLRSLLSRAWEPGSDGKGLVIADGTLHTWATDASGNVHHSPAMELLGLQYAAVIAYLSIGSDGLALDSEWRFE
jgi:hypothetical protein